MPKIEQNQWISAAELANYSVCPEAWRLKRASRKRTPSSERSEESQRLRQDWVRREDLYRALKNYSRISYLLLFALAGIVFLLEYKRINLVSSNFSSRATKTLTEIPGEIALLLLVLGLLIFMWDLFDRHSKKLRTSSGLSQQTKTLSLKGSSYLESKEYRLESLGVSSRPDALVEENGQIVPLDVHPIGDKVRDRHVIPLLVHLRLMAEVDKLQPPHGILLMGKEQRLVRIKNTDDKQRWLSTLIDEMRAIIEGVPAVPAPSKYKCKNCDVRDVCEHSAFVLIKSKSK